MAVEHHPTIAKAMAQPNRNNLQTVFMIFSTPEDDPSERQTSLLIYRVAGLNGRKR
jgi:hypothetical protein